MNRPTTIYAVVDPRSSEVRYVGKTVSTIKLRLSQHLSSKAKSHCGNWFRKMKHEGITPEMLVLETVPPNGEWADAEIFWIANLKFMGADLVNASIGGEGGGLGCIVSAETRAKISAIHKGKIISEATRNKMSISSTGRKYTEEEWAKREKNNYWSTASDAAKLHMSKIKTGVPTSPDALINVRAAIAKVTTEQVMSILTLYDTNEFTQEDLAKTFGIQRGAIQQIVTGKRWKDVYAEHQLTKNNALVN